MFGNSLAKEYETLEVEFGFTRDEIRKIIYQGIDASWISKDRKQELFDRLRNNPDW